MADEKSNRSEKILVSPAFEHDEFELILTWAKEVYDGEVVWEDKVVDMDGNELDSPFPSWTLSWKPGAMSLDYPATDEVKARRTAALFIYLWTRGVYADVAINCARSYSHCIQIETLRSDDKQVPAAEEMP